MNPPNPPSFPPQMPPNAPPPPRLPFDPVRVGRALINVGNGQKRAAAKLDDSSKSLRKFAEAFNAHNRIGDSLSDVSHGIGSIREILSGIRTVLLNIKSKLDDVKVPKVEFTTTSVMGISVVNGIQISSTKPLAEIADRFGDAADKVKDINEALKAIVLALAILKSQLPYIKMTMYNGSGELQGAAVNLNQSGDELINAGVAMGA